MHSGDTVVDLTRRDPATIVQIARDRFNEGRTGSIRFRKKQLNGLIKFLRENEGAIVDAIRRDFRKPEQETVSYEILPTLKDAQHVLNHLDEWAKPERPAKSLMNLMDEVMIYNEPYGVALVIGAWNYPLNLVLSPVVGAIAAGNCVIIKPSEVSSATGHLLAELLPKYIDPECYPVYMGGVAETTDLLKERFDYIFYTGSTQVGRIVYASANRNLTPVTLELGGKSPAYVDNTADLDKTVKRILWGKCINSGQTCVAPDYILCTKEVQDKFVKYAEKVMFEFYGQDVKVSPDYCRIVTDRHFDRLVGLLSGLKVAIGGGYEEKERFMEPTIAIDVNPNHPIMQEEIFGPILPIVPISSVEEAIIFINKRDKPLALYIFSNDNKVQKKILMSTSSGGVCINDAIVQLSAETLPFGGVGNSGIGAYHGKASFDTFTHKKSVLKKDFGAISEKIWTSRYPPYSDSKLSFVRLGMKERRRLPMKYLPHLVMFLLGAGVTVALYFIYMTVEF